MLQIILHTNSFPLHRLILLSYGKKAIAYGLTMKSAYVTEYVSAHIPTANF